MVLTSNSGPKNIVLDHEVLASCAHDDDIETWRRKLRSAGVLNVDLSQSHVTAVGDPMSGLAAIQRRFFELETLESEARSGHHGAMIVDVNDPETRVRAAQAGTVFVALVLFGVWGFLLGGAGAAAIQLWFNSHRPAQSNSSARRVFLARNLQQHVQELAALTFVDASEGVVFENSPHRTFLLQRIQDVHRALMKLDEREGQLVGLRDGLIVTNRRLGRPEEDEEVLAIGREMRRIGEQRVKLTELERHLDEQLARFETALEHLRLLATRRALSDHVGRLLEGPEAETVRRAAAAIEVDILELEGRFRELSVELSDADAQLRAVLEVQGELMRR